jgi:hypothetical protein
VGRGGGYAKATGSNAGAEMGQRPLLVPPTRLRVAHCLRRSGLRPCNFRAIAARAEPKGRMKSLAVQEGEIRAAGPDGILLPGPEGDDRSPPPQ